MVRKSSNSIRYHGSILLASVSVVDLNDVSLNKQVCFYNLILIVYEEIDAFSRPLCQYFWAVVEY